MPKLPGDELDRFITETIALVPGGMTYNPLGKSPGKGKILSYKTFIWIVSKYLRQDPRLEISVVDPPRAPGQFEIQFIGTRSKPSLHPRRAFVLPLNDALALGVQPEQIRAFRKLFGLHEHKDDKRFFQLPVTYH